MKRNLYIFKIIHNRLFFGGKKMQETRKKILIVYLDDDGNTINAYTDIIEYLEGFIRFETHKNIISIPTIRVLKIKEEVKP